MTFTEAAAQVLRLVGKPLHYKEITDVAIERNLLSHVGKSPEVTMGARLAALVKKADKDNPLVRIKPGVFALREWDDKTIEEGLADRTPALDRIAAREAQAKQQDLAASGSEEEAPKSPEKAPQEPAPEPPKASHKELGDAAAPQDEEEKRRAALSAAATELFEAEEDDDKPIFGAAEEEAEAESGDDEGKREGRRRRRRRRGRGRKEEETNGGEEEDDLPGYTVSDAPVENLEEVEEAPEEMPAEAAPEPEEEGATLEAGRGLADAIVKAMGRFERNRGPVSLQNVADALRRRGRGSDGANAGVIAAAAAADNLRSSREGRTPRFRLGGGRIALTAWSTDRKVFAQQRTVESAVAKLRELSRRALVDSLKGLPQRAQGELIVVLLEQMGVEGLQSVRRPGTHGSELHLQGTLRSNGGAIPTAIVVRRDGKDIGRERVTELRGALHHYGRATHGLIITTGQILSGAREEAAVDGAASVALIDGLEVARLCEQYGVGVTTTTVEIPTVDATLFESLRG